MTQKNDFSNTNIRIGGEDEKLLSECADPRKYRNDFPCGFSTVDRKCLWRGDKPCKPIKLDWYIQTDTDKIGALKW